MWNVEMMGMKEGKRNMSKLGLGASLNDRDAKTAEQDEEIEFQQLKNDGKCGALVGVKYIRFVELAKKFEKRDYENKVFQEEKRILNQARNIVTRSLLVAANEKNEPAPDLSMSVINQKSRIVLKSAAFKKVLKELDASSKDVNPDVFFIRYMQEEAKLGEALTDN